MPLPSAIAFVDLETTGAHPGTDRITEIGIVELRDGEVTRWSTLVNPRAPIPAFIQNLTGITPDMVEDAPTFEELADEVLARLSGRVFVAHNVRFDYGFIKAALKRTGHDFRAPTLCTVKLSRRLFPQHHKHNLDSLVERHGLRAEGERHRALADADLLRQFWQMAQAELPPEALESAVAQLLALPRLPAGVDGASVDDLPEGHGVFILFGEGDEPLYVGRDSQVRKKVLALLGSDKKESRALLPLVRRAEGRETAGELGAALLEARLLAQLRPRFNRLKAELEGACSWCLEPASGVFLPRLVEIGERLPGADALLFGLFPSPKEARSALSRIAKAHGLCASLLGLAEVGRACLPAAGCRGACAGKEPVSVHGARLMAALAKLRLAPWPWSGPVALEEKDHWTGRVDVHVVQGWRWLGTVNSDEGLRTLLEDGSAAFDPELYRILEKAVRQGKLPVRTLVGFSTEKAGGSG